MKVPLIFLEVRYHGVNNLDKQYHNSYKNENVEKEMNLFNNSSRNRIYF